MAKKNVIVVSLGNSGSGAVFDYLRSRKDMYTPFYGEEFRLFNDPQGIYSLYLNLYKNPGNNIYSFFFDEFEKYFKSLNRIKKNKNEKKISIFDKAFFKKTENYLKKIIYLEFNALPQFKRIQLNFLDKVNYLRHSKIMKKSINEHKYFKVRLPIVEKKFIIETKKYLHKITYKKNNQNVLLNQSINVLNIKEHQKFFSNCKVVVVTRDPRSIFSSMKSRNSFAFPGKDVKIFINWYQDLFKKLKTQKKMNNTLIIKYENFLENFDQEKKRLCKFININTRMNSGFNVNSSKKNLYKAKKILTTKELKLIEKNLKSYLQW
ncbi:sulfotransferase [Candidatus Pelagibacter sp.]|nr:sulfotransferase [Candidatus Pelagibacter sp.]